MGIGFYELMILLFIVLLIFGGRKLPEVAKGMGKALREFRKAAREGEEVDKELKEIPEEPRKSEDEKTGE